jgi:hypothetical protein
VFKPIFAYNISMQTRSTIHPAAEWTQDARRLQPADEWRLRLAAMAGHMRLDKIAARRAALIDLLADGRPHPRKEIWQTVADRLGVDCWGKLPQEALARDLSALRKGGIRIAYSRRPEVTGYYLQHPPLQRPSRQQYEAVNWEILAHIGQLSVSEKNKRAFAAADFALRQKRLILAESHPEWSPEQLTNEARRLVFGVSEESFS